MVRRLACVVLLVSATARAQSVKIETAPAAPGEKPALVVTPDADAAKIHADLMHDGHVVALDHGAASAGEAVRLPLPSTGKYTGKLHVTFGDKPMIFDLKLDAVAARAARGQMKIGYDDDSADLDAHTLAFTLSRPAREADLRVLGEDGEELAHATATYHGERPGTRLSIHWTPARAGTVAKLELWATSTDGVRAGVALVPWSINVPHQEVVFESGKADIRSSEEPKLDAAYQRIIDEVAKARKVNPGVPVRLFVAGYTDTVGSAADNRKLSLARARSIAQWFHDRGLPLAVAYAGFGEDVLRVPTPDETDNAANRRADYIVGFSPPRIGRGVRATWYSLR